MTRYCLDTSAYSQFKRGHAPVVELIDAATWVGVSAIVLGELWLGYGLGNRFQRKRAEIEAFLRSPVVEEIPVDGDVAQIFGEIAVTLRKQGTPIPTNDIWIAATAVRTGSTLLTYDGDFRQIERVAALILKGV